MKIAIVTNSLTGGGAERAMNLAANALDEAGVEVVLIPINTSAEDLIKVFPKVTPVGRDPKSGIFAFLRVISQFRDIIKLENPDLIFLNCDLPELLGLTLSFRHKLVVIEHANPPWSNRILLGRFTRLIHKIRGTKFVAVSGHLRIWPFDLIPQAIFPNIITPSVDGKYLPDTGKIDRLIFIGRLTEFQKRPSWLLKIAQGTHLPVMFIGEGAERSFLELEFKTFNLNAKFLGYVENPWSHIGINDLLIVPSLFEGDGLVILEAVKNNVAILLSDIPDFRRFDFDDSFYCVDEVDFISRIQTNKLNIEKFRVSQDMKTKLANSRSPDRVVNVWLNFIQAQLHCP
jgi:glycosyltransferase involved in cell wall biosynthesis